VRGQIPLLDGQMWLEDGFSCRIEVQDRRVVGVGHERFTVEG
jgi:hypothetical protein